MSKPNKKLKKIIEKGAEIGGGVTGATIGLFVAGPAGALGGAVLGPLITSVFKKIGLEISEKIMGPREIVRVGATYSLALTKIENKIKTGKATRGDDFFISQSDDRSKAESILEGTLLKVRNEYEEKKIKYYANFLANLNFDESISFEKGNTLLKIIEQISYRQINILGFFMSLDHLNVQNWMISFTEKEELGNYQDFYSEIMDLYNLQLLQQGGNGISLGMSSLKLSPFGKSLCSLLEITEIEDAEKGIIEKTIKEIRGFV